MARILIIDDDEQLRSMLSALLKKAGHDIEQAPDGLVALKLLKDRPFDLVITDIIMPEKEGIETIIELKRDYPGVKIIAMSGGGRVDPKNYLETAGRLGADRTLSKPFRPTEIINLIKELVK